MNLELLDAYNIRARLSASIILLAPIAITLFLCFEELQSVATCSIILFVLLAFTNYVPIMQRQFSEGEKLSVNYAAEMLLLKDNTFDPRTKERYYRKLALLDESFSLFNKPDDSDRFYGCCESAVIYLRSHTREDRLIQEENINYGLCKNLLANKVAGIILCILSVLFTTTYSYVMFDSFSSIPLQNYVAFALDAMLLLFWIFGINKNMLKVCAVHYAKALIMSIDSF